MSGTADEQVMAEGKHLRLMRRRGWEYADRPSATGIVAVLAVTDEGRLILTEQYREPVRKSVIELPAGLAGDIRGEESEALAKAAHRELREETGYEAAQMVYLTEGPPSAGLSTEIITFFRAVGLRRVSRGGGVGHEKIKVHEVPLVEAATWLQNAAARGLLIDPKVYTGLYFAAGVMRDKRTMRFIKMHGLGNDYVVVNGFEEHVSDPASLARAMSDRRRGIGSDGLILIGPAEDADVRMEMYNADGSRGAMCGNGLRCVAKCAYEHGLCRKSPIRVATDCGVRSAECFLECDRVAAVRVAMGATDYVPQDLPAFAGRRQVIDEPFLVNERELRGTFVSTGNPHLVVFVRDFQEIDLATDGPVLESHECFPGRINVHFAKVDSRSEITMISWERGSGAVQACGTGACAVADVAFRRGSTSFPTTVHLPGGDLVIEREAEALLMTGPAEEVFSGAWTQ